MDVPGGPVDPDLGLINYEAFRDAHPEGDTMPKWEQLDEAAQRGWTIGAAAVRDALLKARPSA